MGYRQTLTFVTAIPVAGNNTYYGKPLSVEAAIEQAKAILDGCGFIVDYGQQREVSR
jgi:hypothetical protein